VIVAAVVVLGMLVLAQVYLARRSRRRLNPGLVLASLLVTVLVGWLAVAGLVSARAAGNARTHGGEPLGTVVTARILAQQARADKIRGLLNGVPDTKPNKTCEEQPTKRAGLLKQQPVDQAADALSGWVQAHDDIRHRLTAGDYPGAVAIARDNEPHDS